MPNLSDTTTIDSRDGAVQARPASNPSVPREPTTQVPGVYRWLVGSMTVTAVADGYAEIPLAMVPEATSEAADAMARAAFVAPGDLQCVINTFAEAWHRRHSRGAGPHIIPVRDQAVARIARVASGDHF